MSVKFERDDTRSNYAPPDDRQGGRVRFSQEVTQTKQKETKSEVDGKGGKAKPGYLAVHDRCEPLDHNVQSDRCN